MIGVCYVCFVLTSRENKREIGGKIERKDRTRKEHWIDRKKEKGIQDILIQMHYKHTFGVLWGGYMYVCVCNICTDVCMCVCRCVCVCACCKETVVVFLQTLYIYECMYM